MTDPGLEALEHAVAALQIDAAFATRPDGRSVTWWPGRLAQRLVADPPLVDAGTTVGRLRAETVVLEGVDLDVRRGQVLSAMAAGLVFSAVLVDGGRLSLVADVYAHPDAADWCARSFAFAAAMQASQAAAMAGRLAGLLGARVAESAHPEAGPRTQDDEMLHLAEALVRPRGSEPSPFDEKELGTAWNGVFGPLGIAPRRDGPGWWAPLPVGEGEAIVLANPQARHPVFGSGALVRAALRVEGRERAPRFEDALALTAAECSTLTRAHLLGAWYPEQERLVHDVFLPSASWLPGSLGHVLFAQALRLRWACRRVAEQDTA